MDSAKSSIPSWRGDSPLSQWQAPAYQERDQWEHAHTITRSAWRMAKSDSLRTLPALSVHARITLRLRGGMMVALCGAVSK